ncbi:3-hydroxyacyl-CoA dehydrogenase family protein [Leucothrix arctica]|uniref:3-hydroxyacyl-CoA dehydrogenase n=1 Tax=Leucothrix arctica TaxID=1481894 RepID=A0A317C5G7_9GAMM|nr:3-hydroxyacyl-CoA dehydrogenase NAD-binding domain-containing protein [Leucothrix arctica]PWQ93519.1 3-hydroxyacyl-CoA dehydrogenase [Leucothrix arctica]
MSEQRHIGIIGAGLMGHGIALVMARAGHTISITDPMPAAREALIQHIAKSLTALGVSVIEQKPILQRIAVYETLEETVKNADVVFEAAPEKLPLKQQIFADIERYAPAHCILASNTSVIQISKIMIGLKTRHRAVGTHWWNPPHMIPLVEVIKTEWTDSTVADDMMALLTHAEKTPVMVEKDVPGFIGNRLQHALWREAISLVERGICDAKAVDTVIKASFGRRLAVLGPLENSDLVGTDLTLDIHENVLFDLESRQGPSPYLQKLVDEGKLGMKSGEGFQKWTAEEADEVRNKVSSHLSKLETIIDKS